MTDGRGPIFHRTVVLMLARSVCVVALILAGAGAAEAGGDDAMAKIMQGDCAGAGEQINEGLARKEARAYLLAGYLYDVTGCVAHDASRAERFYRLAMELGDVEAKNFLALMYGIGNGVSQDYQKAYRIFTDARIKDPEFKPVKPEHEYAAGYAYTVTQIARSKATFPGRTEPGVVEAKLDVMTGAISFADEGRGSTRRLRQAVREAYEAAIKEAPPLPTDVSHDVQFSVPWTFTWK